MKKKHYNPSLSNIIIFTLSWVPFSRNEILAEMCKGEPQSSVLHNCQIISIFMVREGVGEKSQKSLLSNGMGGVKVGSLPLEILLNIITLLYIMATNIVHVSIFLLKKIGRTCVLQVEPKSEAEASSLSRMI